MLKKSGILLCRQISFEKYERNGIQDFKGWKEQSDLNLFGYNVNAQENLTAQQRQLILATVIDQDIYTAEELKSFLGFLVDTHSSKIHYQNAIDKWRQDIDFISHYKANKNRAVGIKSISETHYHKDYKNWNKY